MYKYAASVISSDTVSKRRTYEDARDFGHESR